MKTPSFLSVSSNLLSLVFLTACASLEERLCNPTTSFQKGYDDVLNGRQSSPGLKEGEACHKSKAYAYADFHRDYMAGFEKAKKAHCTQDSAVTLGTTDASSDKAFKTSLVKLAICLADEKIKVNLESYYEIGFRKEFCQSSRAEGLGVKDAAGLGESKTNEVFAVCAYEKNALFKTYTNSYSAEIRKQCSPAKSAAMGSSFAREKKNLTAGLVALEKCPKDLANGATQSYTTAYQIEKSNMLEEERLRMEQERLAREEAHRNELIRIRRQQLEIEQQKLNAPKL